MPKQTGVLAGLGAVVAALIAGALFLVLSDPAPQTPSDDAPGTPAATVKEEAGTPAEESTGRRRTRVPGGAVLFGAVRHAGDDTPAAQQTVRLVGESVGAIDVRTDASGAFRFESLPPGGPYAVEVDAEGFAPVRLPGIALDRSEERDLGTLLLDLAVRVEVHVQDMAGEPVAGARVAAYAAPEMSWGFDWSKAMAQLGQAPVAVSHVDTGADGVAVFDELASGSWTFVARKDGFANTGRSSIKLRSRVDAEPVRLYLAEGHTLGGRVLDENGAPVAGALVMGGGGNAWDLGAAALRSRATSGQDGTYRLTALRAGDTPLWVAPAGSTPSQIVTLRIPDVSTFDIHLRSGGVLRGKVTMQEDGSPVEGARVRAMSWGPGGSRSSEAVTDAEGSYAIDDLPEGNVGNITVEKSGLTQVVEDGNPWRPNAFRPGVVVEQNVEMAPGAILTGTVSGPDGPVSGARVMAMYQRGASRFEQKQATTDSEGRYRFDDLTPGRFLVHAAAQGLYVPDFPTNWWMAVQNDTAPEHLSGELVASEETTVDIVLAAGTTVSGRVETQDGQPVAGATVRAQSQNAWMSGTAEPAVSAEDGTFRLEGVVPSPAVSVTAGARGMTMLPGQPIAVDGGEPFEGVRIVMQALPVVRGRVTTSTGELPADAYVQVFATPDTSNGMIVTDPSAFSDGSMQHPVRRDGGFEVPIAFARGQFTVRAGAPGFAPQSSKQTTLEEGRTEYEVDVTLGEGLSLGGRVFSDMTNEGVDGAHVRVQFVGDASTADASEMVAMTRMATSQLGGSDGSVVVAVTDETGAFRASGLAQGNHRVSATAEGFVTGTVDARTPMSGEVSLPLAPEMEISGTVTLGDGTPIEGATVSAAAQGESGSRQPGMTFPGGGGGASSTTDSTGRFEIRGLSRGQYVLNVMNGWGGTANIQPLQSQPTPAGSTDVHLVAQAGLVISGHIVNEAGEPVRQCWIWGNPTKPREGAGSVNVQAKPDGTFRLVGLPHDVEGYNLNFNAQSAGGGYTPAQLENVKPGTTGLEVVMKSGLKIEGRIRDEDGKPLTNAWVMAQAIPVPGDTTPRAGGNAMLEADGSFAIGALQPGRYKLTLQTWNQSGGNRQMIVKGGEDVPAGTNGLELTASAGATISGTVVDETGTAVPNVQVSAGPAAGGRHANAATNENGEFEIGALDESESYTVTARPRGMIGASAPGTPAGTSGLRLVVRRGVTLSGRALAEDGSVLANTWLYLRPVDRQDLTQQNARTDADGRFSVTGLDPGASYAVSSRVRDGAAWKMTELGTVSGNAGDVELRPR